jgi:hypothetical protein
MHIQHLAVSCSIFVAFAGRHLAASPREAGDIEIEEQSIQMKAGQPMSSNDSSGNR